MDPGLQILTATALVLLGTGMFVSAAQWLHGPLAIFTFLAGLVVILAAWALTLHGFAQT